MFNLFFTISFIAEIIIACWVISKIKKLDNSILALNDEISLFKPRFQSDLLSIKLAVNKVLTSLAKVACFVSDKKEECKGLISKNFLSVLVGFIMKIPFKKVLSVIEILLTIRKILRIR